MPQPHGWHEDSTGVLSRYRGSLLGLAVGDAVGTTLEFSVPGSFTPIRDMVGGGPFDLAPGEWTDDTSMALCLATSLVECGGMDPADQMTRYLRWWNEGYLSATGECFDIGNNVLGALSRFSSTGDPWAGSTDPYSAGNGSLMRLAPVPLFFAADPAQAIEMAGESSRTTHGAAAAVDACRYMAGLIVGALMGASKDALLSPLYGPIVGCWDDRPLCAEIEEVASGSFKYKDPPQIQGSGYVVESLEAALWAFHRTHDFRDGLLRAVNLGRDADTTGAVHGQLAGAFYSVEAIPAEWRSKLVLRDEIERIADALMR